MTTLRCVCVALTILLLSSTAQATRSRKGPAKKPWRTIATGNQNLGGNHHALALQQRGRRYRIVRKFAGGLVRLGLGYTYAGPSRRTTEFKKVRGQPLWVAEKGVWKNSAWTLSFGKGGAAKLQLQKAPNYAKPDYEYLKGKAAEPVLRSRTLATAKGSYGSVWSLHMLGEKLFHVIKHNNDKPSVIQYNAGGSWSLTPAR